MEIFKNNKIGGKLKDLPEETRKYVEDLEEKVWKVIPQLAVLKEQYRGVVEGSLVGIYVLQDGVFKYANPAFLKIFSYEKPEEIIGHPWQEIVFKEDVERVLASGFEERMKGRGKPVQYTFRATKKDGKIIEVEVLSQPSFYEDKPAVIGSLLDITEKKQVEEILREKEAWYQTLFEDSRDAIMIFESPLWKFTSGNLSTVQMFRARNEEEFISKEFWALSPEWQPDSRASAEKAKEMIETAIREGSVFFEWTHKRFNGEDFPAAVLLTRINHTGKVFLQATVRDVTKQKQAEEKIKRLYDFQAIIRAINQLIVRIKDEKEFFQQICDTLKKDKLIKFVWIGLVEKEIYEVRPIAQAGFEDSYLSSIKVTWDESEYGKGPTGIAIKTQMPFVMRDIAGDPRYKPWREQALKQGYLSSVALPFIYENEVIGVLNIYSGEKDAFSEEEIEFLKEVAGDIAVGIKSLRQERALEESEGKFRDFLENANDLICKMNQEGKCVYVNKKWRETLEYSSEEAKDLVFLGFVREDNKAYCMEVFERLIKGETADNFETVFVAKNGKEIPLEGSVNSSFKDGKFDYIRGTFRDITERKKAEAQIKKLDELKSRFITIVSHQLRTPLNSIRWNLENLLTGEMDHLPETQKKIVNMSYNASIEVVFRIDDLLLALDIEEGRVARVSKTRTSLESLWNSVMVEELKKCALKKIIYENIISKKSLPAISLDSEKIRLVFQKLCDNAIDYTKEEGKITASLKKIDDQIRFEISDTGIGIPKVEQSPIFGRFYRASNAFTMKPDASGLGLFIAKYFIEQHGGKIGFESEEGKGSTFWFELPL